MNMMKTGVLSVSAGLVLMAQAFEPRTIDLVDELVALNSVEGHPNPWMATTQDGRWGFYGQASADAAAEAWGPFVETETGLVGFCDESRKYCALLANPTDETQSAPSHLGAKIDSRKVIYHPRNATSVETLRFTVESMGVYSIAGTVRKLSTAGDGITLALSVNSRTVVDTTSTTDLQCFGDGGFVLWPDDVIELRLTANGNLANDATELTFAVTKTADRGSIPLPFEMTALWGLERSVRTDPPANPCSVSGHPCVWTFLQRSGSTETLLSARLSETKDDVTYYGLKSPSATYPTIYANSTGASYKPVDAAVPVEAGEMFFVPNSGGETVLRCTVANTGIYSCSARVRHVGAQVQVCNGLNVAIFEVRGASAAERLDGAYLGVGETVSLARTRMFLSAGDKVELVVDANGANGYDSSAILFSVSLDEKGTKMYSAADAMREDANATTPVYENFVDAKGAKWSYGSLNPSGWTFSPVTVEKTKDDFFGWKSSGNGGYPYVCVNKIAADATLESAATHPSELAVHPGPSTSADVRFVVPEDGIYAFGGRIRALNTESAGDGVEGRVILRGAAFVAHGKACGHVTDGLPKEVSFFAQDLWMKAGDVLDVAVGPNTGHSYDASTMSADILCLTNVAPGLHVGFDIRGRDRAPHAGAGRIGYSTDGVWASVKVGGCCSSAGPVIGGCRRAVRLELSKAAGSPAIADVPAIVSDGVVSEGPADPVAFTVSGLTPNASYSFFAFSRNASGSCGVFTVGTTVEAATETWFCPSGGDLCRFSACADEKGEVRGTFAGTANGAATFCGLQVQGEDFPVYDAPGLMLIFR